MIIASVLPFLFIIVQRNSMYTPDRSHFLSALPVIGVLFRFDKEFGTTSNTEYKGERSKFTKLFYSMLVLVTRIAQQIATSLCFL